MKITRDRTGATINRLFNDPQVKPGVIDDNRFLDLSKLAADPRVFCLIGDPPMGAYVAWQLVDGVYEFHAGVKSRGEWALDFTASAIRYMFCGSDAIELVTRIPQGALPALTLARRFGLVQRWTCPETRYRGKSVPYTVWSLTLFAWMPADPVARAGVFVEMSRMGQERKANAWYQRWALLSGEGEAQ